MSKHEYDKLAESYGILKGDLPWHENGREHLAGFSLRSMGFSGFRAQVENRLRQYGWTGDALPSDRYLQECLSNQTCAKRAASAWLRRNRKLSQR